MAVQLDLLKSSPYFSGMHSAELNSVSRFVFERTAERGEVISFEGDPAETLFFVLSGAVKVFKTSAEGKEQILNIIRPGESFNDVPVFDGEPNPASTQAMGPVVLYGIRKQDLQNILREHPQVSANIIKVLGAQIRQLMMLVEDLSFRHVIGRVARILLEHSGDKTDSRPRLTQQEMAAMAGTVREVVSRSLKALEEEGTVKMERHRIIIKDKEALQELVEMSA
ncbi:Crp/Fnr family transcriptional regulator [Chloroflexota bacterium]